MSPHRDLFFFLTFYGLESLCYTCHKATEYIGSSRLRNTTSFCLRGFWRFFDLLTHNRYKNLSSPVTVMPRPLWIKTLVLISGLISPVLAQKIEQLFMLLTMKLRSNSRDDRKPTELEEIEYARNDTEYNRLQNNLVFSGIILGVIDLTVLFTTKTTERNILRLAHIEKKKSNLMPADVEK